MRGESLLGNPSAFQVLTPAASLLPAPADLRQMLANITPRPPALDCRNCGNPAIKPGVPCHYCNVVTGPRPSRPAWECPCCGKVPTLACTTNVMRGERTFVVHCHDEQRIARVFDSEIEDFLEVEQLRHLAAQRIASAIDELFGVERT